MVASPHELLLIIFISFRDYLKQWMYTATAIINRIVFPRAVRLTRTWIRWQI